MKTIKGFALGILFSFVCLSFSTTSFAVEESSSTESSMTKTSETETKNSEQKKELDITPKFKLKDIKAVVGEKGKVEVEPIKGMKGLKGTFKTTIADQNVLSINSQGQWQGLKAGETKVSLDFEWDQESLKKIKENYPDYQLLTQETTQEISVFVSQPPINEIDITPNFNTGTIDAKIGETGQFKVAPMGGVANITGTYTIYSPEDAVQNIISVDSDGKWTALKAGTVEFVLDFQLSEESRNEIAAKNPGSTLVTRAIANLIKVNVSPAGILDITPTIDVTSIDAKVGDTGQLKVKPIEGFEDTTGTFISSVQDPTIIKVDATGKWTALKAGTTEFTILYNWSDATMKKLTEKYPGYEFSTREIVQSVTVTITEKTINTTKPTGRQLPATNESRSSVTWIIGLVLIVLAVTSWSKRWIIE